MNNNVLIDKLSRIISPVVESLNYEFYHLEYVKENGENYLRIYIANENGISLEDCEKVSRRISDLLDEEDPITDPYYLEVSSPGINRFLYTDKHFQRSIGQLVLLKLVKAANGKKAIKGQLIDFNESEVVIKEGNENINIDREKIKSINLEGEI